MGLLDKIFGTKKNDPYRSVADFAKNRSKQLEMSPQTIAVMREHGVNDETLLPLEFFFYTNAEEKAVNLSNELTARGYSSSHESSSVANNEFLVNGWTSPIKMDEKSVLEWTAEMCDRGASHDCQFDGWGTSL